MSISFALKYTKVYAFTHVCVCARVCHLQNVIFDSIVFIPQEVSTIYYMVYARAICMYTMHV